jgi:hypothetical protein
MRSLNLITLPFAFYVMIAIIYNNYLAWVTACGTDFLCASPNIAIFGPNADRLTSGIFGFFNSASPNYGNIFSVFGNLSGSGWLGFASSIIGIALIAFSFIRYVTLSSYLPAIGITETSARFMLVLGILLLLWGIIVSWLGGWQEALPYDGGVFIDLILMVCFVWGGWTYATGG